MAGRHAACVLYCISSAVQSRPSWLTWCGPAGELESLGELISLMLQASPQLLPAEAIEALWALLGEAGEPESELPAGHPG